LWGIHNRRSATCGYENFAFQAIRLVKNDILECTHDKSIFASHILEPEEEVVVGFQMMRLQAILIKQFKKLRGGDIDNSYDIFKLYGTYT
jgi:hypothetical protein